MAQRGTTSGVPRAVAVPMALVMRLAVEVEIVMGTAPVPVVTPARVPELTRTPLIVGERPGDGLGDTRRTQTGEP